MEEIKLARSRKYEDKIKEYNLQDIERHEQEILEKARKYQEYKDELSRKNLIIRLWHRILQALRIKHPERNFINSSWHTIQETESDKWEIVYFYNHRKKTLNFDNIFHLQSCVAKSESKDRFLNVTNKELDVLDKIVFLMSFMYACLLPIVSTWEFIQELNSGTGISKETWWTYLFVMLLTVALDFCFFYLSVRISRKENITLWKVAKETKWNEKLSIFSESSTKQARQIIYEFLYFVVLWLSVGLVFHVEVLKYAPFEVLKDVHMEYFMLFINIYCGISLIFIVLRLFISPFGFFVCSVVITAFLMNVNLWTGITLFVTLWTALLTKKFWMLNPSSEVPEYIINPTDKSSRIMEANLLKIKVYTSIGVLVTYYLIALVDKYRPYYHTLLFLGRLSEEELNPFYYQIFTYLIDRLMVFGFVIIIMFFVKESYTARMKGAIHDIIDSSISSLHNLIYRNVKEVEVPKIKEKVGLSIAYLDKIKPIQLLENSEALPKGIQVLVEGTDDPHKRKVVVIMPDLTVHSGIVEFEP